MKKLFSIVFVIIIVFSFFVYFSVIDDIDFLVENTSFDRETCSRIRAIIARCGFDTITEIYEKSEDLYLINAGCYFEALIENGNVTWIKVYSTDISVDSVTLYSKDNGVEKKLTEDEISSYYFSQRQYLVCNSVSIKPRSGILLQESFNSKYSITVTNKSDTAINSINIYAEPFMIGCYPNSTKKVGNSYENTIYPNKSVGLTTTHSFLSDERCDWRNYDNFIITKVQIFWADGTSIEFNNFDCQFLDTEE